MNATKKVPEKKKVSAGDKRTIGITSANERVLTALIGAGNFGAELDAAKFAMAHAINKGSQHGTTDGANTKWNVGTVDPDGSLRALIESVYGEVPEPYRLIEHLINEGLRLLGSSEPVAPDVVGLLIQAGAVAVPSNSTK